MCEADCVATPGTRSAVMVSGDRPEQKRLYIFAPECSLGWRTLDAIGRLGRVGYYGTVFADWRSGRVLWNQGQPHW
jgi:hypothetical protein